MTAASTLMEKILSPSRSSLSLVLLIAGAVFLFANNQMIGVTLPVYITRLGGTAGDVGLIGGAASLGALVGRLLVGFALPQVGMRRLLVVASLCLLPLTLLYLPLTALAPILILRMVHATFFAALMTVYFAAAVEHDHDREAGVTLALAGLAMPVSLAIFPYLASAAVHRSFSLVIVLASLAAITMLLFFSASAVRQRAELKRSTATAPSAGESTSRHSMLFLGLLLFAATSFGLTDGVAIDLIPIFAQHMGIADYGFYFVVYALSLLLAQMAIAPLLARLGAGGISVAGLLLMAAAFVLLGLASGFPLLLVVAILQSVGFAAAQTAVSALSIQGLPRPLRGLALSRIYLLFEVGRGGGLVIIGQVILWAGVTVAAFLVGLWCLCAAGAIVIALYRTQ